ncbi:YjcZ family sporulation protein [Caldalkalibacillus thermarum TA2.A1]|uniref:YjcZ family sporulation protein n=1 Tax=Caldalkalibacillus thermarum (strain TA2.A1) TaxID=986075 RepID=A0A8X8IB02_CALTT|nr:YjcZ family sporulation protein [Caldalkalibacillus thermarum]QZT35014.1 YjcZ family sporulation protein [Caldalkalibacillus thermarum TA2.A1]
MSGKAPVYSFHGGFTLIVVLFILLVIVGCSCWVYW